MLVEASTVYLIKKVMGKSGSIDIPADGNSMFPFIKKGNICTFEVVDPNLLKKGDIALFESSSGLLVAHRFIQAKSVAEKQYYIFKGDTNLGSDIPVQKDRIIGKLSIIQKNKMKINVKDLPALLYGKLILSLPILSGLLRSYLNRKNGVNV